ncbi:hypothetical protein OAL71_02255 [Phycisphaerales bacterium]|nr:hypothetical protein [Phycisphaerales bacterium]
MTLNNLQNDIANEDRSDELKSRFVALSYKIDQCINTITGWISEGLISEPRSYSEDLGNLVLLIDDMVAIEVGFLADSLPSGFRSRGTDLNSHYASEATHRDLLDRLRRRCYRNSETPLHANAIQQLRTAFPREKIWTEQWIAIESALTAWIQSHFDDPPRLAAGVSLLSSAVISDPRLQATLDEANGPIEAWNREKDEELHRELVLKAIEAHERGDLEATTQNINQARSIGLQNFGSPIEHATMSQFEAAQNWVQESLEFADATQFVDDASESVRQLLDEDAPPAKIEVLFDRLRNQAKQYKIEVDPGLVHRVRTRLQEARKAGVFRRRLAFTISTGVLIVAAGVFGIQFEIKRRANITENLIARVENLIPLWINDDSLRLASSPPMTRSEAIAGLRPDDADEIINESLENHAWLAGASDIQVMTKRCLLTRDLQDNLFQKTLADLNDLLRRLESTEINTTFASKKVEISSRVADSSGRSDLTELAQAVQKLIITIDARSLVAKKIQLESDIDSLVDRLKTAESQWPGDDELRRPVASAWKDASLVWQGIEVDANLLLADVNALNISGDGRIEEIRFTAAAKRHMARNLAERNRLLDDRLQSLPEPVRMEQKLTEKLRVIVQEFGDLLNERGLLESMEESLQAAAIMNATQDWRKTIWPDLKAIREDPSGARATTAARTRELQGKIEDHLDRFPFSPLKDDARILQATLARGSSATTSDLNIAKQSLAQLDYYNLVQFTANSGKVLARETGDGRANRKLILYDDDLFKPIDQLTGVLPLDPKITIVGTPKPPVPIVIISGAKKEISNATGYRLSMLLLDAIMELQGTPNTKTVPEHDVLLRLKLLHWLAVLWIDTCGETFPNISREMDSWQNRVSRTLLTRDWPRSMWDGNSQFMVWKREAEESISRFPLLQPMIDTSLADRRRDLDSGSPVVPIGTLGPDFGNGRSIKWIGDERPEGVFLVPTRSEDRAWVLTPLQITNDGAVETDLDTPKGVVMIYLRNQDA